METVQVATWLQGTCGRKVPVLGAHTLNNTVNHLLALESVL